MDQRVFQYIERYILKKGEEIEATNFDNKESSITDLKIIKRTKRTYRIMAILTVSRQLAYCERVDEKLLRLNFTPSVKRFLKESDEIIFNWLGEGLIIKEIRLKDDGKTEKEHFYRMGPALFYFQQGQKKLRENEAIQQFEQWKNEMKESLLQKNHRSSALPMISELRSIIKMPFKDFLKTPAIPLSWSFPKRMKFLSFSLAFLNISGNKNHFDWKEIGASYYKEIGGSKEFDAYQSDFIMQLEEWLQCPTLMMGLTSLGRITPVFFVGNLTGRYASFEIGPVHALTDLSIAEDEYVTEATTLWLVENRSVLTRMAAEEEFLVETNSLVLCVDGQLRSAHQKCIKQIVKSSSIKQVIIWSDYDQAGMIIAETAYRLLSDRDDIIVKLISINGTAYMNWEDYAQWMTCFLTKKSVEQEVVMGEVEQWKGWINRINPSYPCSNSVNPHQN